MSFLVSVVLCLVVGYFLWQYFTGKWQEVYITQDVEAYMKVSGTLQGAGLRYKSATGGQEFNSRRSGKTGNLPAISYSISVPEDKAHVAQQLINELKW